MTKDVYRHYAGTVWLWVSLASDLPTGGDGLQQKADGGARFALDILPILQALANKQRMGEDHDGPQNQLSRCARVDRLEFAGLDSIAQDELHGVAEGILVCANMVPVVLDRDQHDVVYTLLREQIFLVVGQDLEDQALNALASRGLGARNRPGSFLDL